MELVDLANAFPDVTIILNHIGRPLGTGPYAGKRDEVFEDWKRGMIRGCGLSKRGRESGRPGQHHQRL